MLKSRRVKLMRKTTELYRQLGDSILKFDDLAANRFIGLRKMAIELAQADGQSGHLLNQIVMQFPGDILTFFFLRNDQFPRQVLNLFMTFPQSLLCALAFANVLDNQDQTVDRPVLPAHTSGGYAGINNLAITVDKPLIHLVTLSLPRQCLVQQADVL